MKSLYYLSLFVISSVFSNATEIHKSYINGYGPSSYSLNKRATAATFIYKDEITKVLTSLGLDANLIISNSSEACLTSIENTHDCFDSVNKLLVAGTTALKFDDVCNVYESQICDYFRNTVVTGNSGCINDYDKQFFSINFDISIFYYTSLCTKNTNNELCPAVSFYRSIFSKDVTQATDEKKVEIVNQSCTDAKCSDQMKKVVAVTPSVIKSFEIMFAYSNQTQESLNQIKTALDVTAMQQPVNACQPTQPAITSNAVSYTAFTIALTAFFAFASLLVMI